MSEIKTKTITGIAWVGASQVTKQFLQLLISIVLARLLTPTDFGLVAMVLVFTGFAELFGELGFSSALVQNQKVTERYFSSVFWLNILVGLGLTVFIMIAAPLVAKFYNESKLVWLTMLISVDFLINPLTMVQEAILNRNMQFRLLAVIEIMGIIVAGMIAIGLALVGYGVWSLAWHRLATSTFKTVLLWQLSDWRPGLLFDRETLGELIKFSSNLVGFKVINYWVRNGDNLLVGKILGTSALGVYSRAYMIMLLPVTQITQVLGRVMFPALSIIQDDKAWVKSIYLRSVTTIALLTFPIALGLLVVAERFVLVVYGAAWMELVPLLQIFSLLSLIQSIGVTAGWIYQSQGRTDLMFRWGILAGLVALSSIFIGVWIGTVVAVATCYTFASGVLLPYPLFTLSGRLIDTTFEEIVQSVKGIFGCSVIMVIAVWGIGLVLPPQWLTWLSLVIQVSFGIIVYSILLHLFRVKAYIEVRELLNEKLRTQHYFWLS